ncbi:hypothetical protein V496_09262 [Pseudogymnoascus sp. VKM F-4515 (FW-2607)]|nr:hypothetical protein V496_09262 [Pseudogymnoascus sp. VKM F-4515 (FW-2607)]
MGCMVSTKSETYIRLVWPIRGLSSGLIPGLISVIQPFPPPLRASSISPLLITRRRPWLTGSRPTYYPDWGRRGYEKRKNENC